VTIDEILRLVNIALGTASIDTCPAGDVDGNLEITIEEIIAAVNAALNGCPSPPPTNTPTIGSVPPSSTATATDTPGPAEPTATPASGGTLARNAAHTLPLLARSLTSVPAVLSAIGQIAGGGRAARQVSDVRPCSGGGTLDFTCSQTTPSVSPRDYQVGFAACELEAGSGSVDLNGTVTGRSTESGFLAICSLPPLELSTLNLTNVEVALNSAGGNQTLQATFNANGSLKATPDLASACRIAALDLTLSGTVVTTVGTITSTMTFDSTRLVLTIDAFSADCVPVAYRLGVDGPLSIQGPPLAGGFQGVLSGFVLQVKQEGVGERMALSGNVTASCFDGSVGLTTPVDLNFAASAPCPDAGVILLTGSGAAAKLTFDANGVSIDTGNNGSVDETLPSCAGPLCE
jgi:hypothetical protein